MTRLLEGDVVPEIDPELERLRARVRTLEREVSDAKVEAKRAREDAERALSMLRKQLGPLYRALQAVFGELDAAGVHDDVSSEPGRPATNNPPQDTRVAAVWDSWKSRLGSSSAKVIEALQLHSDLNTQQLVIATGLARNTISDAIYRMNKAGLVNKNGGRFSLKQL